MQCYKEIFQKKLKNKGKQNHINAHNISEYYYVKIYQLKDHVHLKTNNMKIPSVFLCFDKNDLNYDII